MAVKELALKTDGSPTEADFIEALSFWPPHSTEARLVRFFLAELNEATPRPRKAARGSSANDKAEEAP